MAERKPFNSRGEMTFGKHSGKHWSKIPESYLQWASCELHGFQDALEAAREIPIQEERQRAPGSRIWNWPRPLKHYNDRIAK